MRSLHFLTVHIVHEEASGGSTTTMVTRFLAISMFTPTFIPPALAIALLGVWLGQVYMKAQLSVKREMSNAKAPVLGMLGGAISGLRTSHHLLCRLACLRLEPASIRAYDAQENLRKETAERIDRYVRTARTFYNLNRCATRSIVPHLPTRSPDGSPLASRRCHLSLPVPWLSTLYMEGVTGVRLSLASS